MREEGLDTFVGILVLAQVRLQSWVLRFPFSSIFFFLLLIEEVLHGFERGLYLNSLFLAFVLGLAVSVADRLRFRSGGGWRLIRSEGLV